MIGKPGTAPCGHPGEVMVGNYVRCLRGCDSQAVPEHVETETTQPMHRAPIRRLPCLHQATYEWDGVIWCAT